MKKTLKDCPLHGHGANGLGCYCEIKKPKMKLKDRLWDMLCYGKDIKDKDLPKYAKSCAESLQEDLKNWIDDNQIMIEKDKWYLDVKDVKGGIK